MEAQGARFLHLVDLEGARDGGTPNLPVAERIAKEMAAAQYHTIRQGDTLGNYFAHLYPQLTFRPVNRLDRDTSGLCMIAKDALAAKLLQGCCKKVYYAAVHGDIPESGTIDAPIARERESIILRCVREDSDPLTGEPITVSSELPEDIKSLFPTGGIVWKK